MSKRTRTADNDTDTDTDISEFLEVASDGSHCEAPKSRSKKTRQKRKVASKRGRIHDDGSHGVARRIGTSRVTHPTSWHVVVRVDPVRESLLHWYQQIHEVRGMPWRKTFGGSLDEGGRAQRAYEVRFLEEPVIPRV